MQPSSSSPSSSTMWSEIDERVELKASKTREEKIDGGQRRGRSITGTGESNKGILVVTENTGWYKKEKDDS